MRAVWGSGETGRSGGKCWFVRRFTVCTVDGIRACILCSGETERTGGKLFICEELYSMYSGRGTCVQFGVEDRQEGLAVSVG